MTPPGKYSSSLRAEQAAQTRQRVLAAAGALFAADGFSRTTLARVAEAAEVSVETVQAQGSKRSLLTAAVHQLSFGGGETSFPATPQAASLFEATTGAEFCERGAELVGGVNAQTFRLWRAFVSAAADDPGVDRELSELAGFIGDQCRQIVDLAASRGWLRDDVGVDELGDSLWVLVGSENYDKITTRLGWSHQRYLSWLIRSLHDLLLPKA